LNHAPSLAIIRLHRTARHSRARDYVLAQGGRCILIRVGGANSDHRRDLAVVKFGFLKGSPGPKRFGPAVMD
jgi:hypothetical protein